MRLSELADFPYDSALLCHGPTPFRDDAKLMVLRRDGRKIEERKYSEIGTFLRGEDVWINDSKIYPAKVHLWRDTGEKVETYLTKKLDPEGRSWEAILRCAAHLTQDGDRKWRLDPGGERAKIVGHSDQRYTLEFDRAPDLQVSGKIATSPWLRVPKDRTEWPLYEPVYAETVGAMNPPTAGVHFTPELLAGLALKKVTLHLDPFAARRIESPVIVHHGQFMVPESYRIHEAPTRPGIAIGTTVVKALETFAQTGKLEGETALFVCPPFDFKFCRGFLTNFHMPRETMLAMAAAFVGDLGFLRDAYRLAVEKRYRFSDYGDSCLIL